MLPFAFRLRTHPSGQTPPWTPAEDLSHPCVCPQDFCNISASESYFIKMFLFLDDPRVFITTSSYPVLLYGLPRSSRYVGSFTLKKKSCCSVTFIFTNDMSYTALSFKQFSRTEITLGTSGPGQYCWWHCTGGEVKARREDMSCPKFCRWSAGEPGIEPRRQLGPRGKMWARLTWQIKNDHSEA